jgi:hypothetical protein
MGLATVWAILQQTHLVTLNGSQSNGALPANPKVKDKVKTVFSICKISLVSHARNQTNKLTINAN